jgi:hypothetical protein
MAVCGDLEDVSVCRCDEPNVVIYDGRDVQSALRRRGHVGGLRGIAPAIWPMKRAQGSCRTSSSAFSVSLWLA